MHFMVNIPSGEFYNAYKLVKSFRDGMQKALWVNPKVIPNAEKLQQALTEMFRMNLVLPSTKEGW